MAMSVVPFAFIRFGDRIRANSKFCQHLREMKEADRRAEEEEEEEEEQERGETRHTTGTTTITIDDEEKGQTPRK